MIIHRRDVDPGPLGDFAYGRRLESTVGENLAGGMQEAFAQFEDLGAILGSWHGKGRK